MTACYSSLTLLTIEEPDPGLVVLEIGDFQLVIVAMALIVAATITLGVPPLERTETPIKLVLPVRSLSVERSEAPSLGGRLRPASDEWVFQGRRVFDGVDSEDNAVQCADSEEGSRAEAVRTVPERKGGSLTQSPETSW